MDVCFINQSKFNENLFNLSGVFASFIYFSSDYNSKNVQIMEFDSKNWPVCLKALKLNFRSFH